MEPHQQLIHVEDVSVVRDGKAILAVPSLTIQKGESVAILGPNGSGKSTLVKLITREIYPHAGEGKVLIEGETRAEQSALRKAIGAATHDLEAALIDDQVSAKEIALSGLFGTVGTVWGEDVLPEHEALAERALQKMGMTGLGERAYNTLSSGEKRRTWIARGLVNAPQTLVLDEPTAHLDPAARNELRRWLRAFVRDGGSLILVTHLTDEIFPEFDRVIQLAEGKVVQDSSRTDWVLRAASAVHPAANTMATPEFPTPEEYLQLMREAPVYDVAIRSPLDYAPVLSGDVRNHVWLKREDLQPVFSFKLRGAYVRMAKLTADQLRRGVVAASAGNHAQGVALAAQRLGTSATIVVPVTTPKVKTDAIVRFGAELILHGENYDAAYEHAVQLGERRGLTFIHPYDHPDVIAGQGTIGLEIDEQAPSELEAVFVAVGGGGLISGVALALKQLRPGIKIIGVEPEDSDAMHRSLRAGERVTLDKVGLLADGVAVRRVGANTFPLAQEWIDEVVVVSNDAICAAVQEIFEDRRAVLEPSGALAYAGLKKYAAEHDLRWTHLAAIACGANLNFDRLRYVAERAQVGGRREAILASEIPERPGSFREFCLAIGQRSVTEFNYRYANAGAAHVFVGLAVGGASETSALVERLNDAGYPTTDLSGDEFATTHLRHMVGGRGNGVGTERLFHFDFPERAGALGTFLDRLGDRFNITLFHYRNIGSDRGRVLIGFDIPAARSAEFDEFRWSVGYDSTEVTDNPGLRLFLGPLEAPASPLV